EIVDRKVAVHELRKLLHAGEFQNDGTLHALIQRYLQKAEKTGADRDKLDCLLAHVLRTRSAHAAELSLEDAARHLEPILGKSSAELPQWLQPLEALVADLQRCATLHDLDTD